MSTSRLAIHDAEVQHCCVSLFLFDDDTKIEWRIQDFPDGYQPLIFEPYYYHPQTKLQEGNVFTGVCNSVNRGVPAPGGVSGWGGVPGAGGLVPGGCLVETPL